MPAEIRVKAKLDGSEMKTGLAQLGTDAKSFASDQIGSIKSAIAGAFTIGSVVAFGQSLLELGGQISATASALGVSTDALQGLNAAAQANGSSAETLSASLSKLKDKQGEVINGNKAAVESFQRLGISAEDVAGLDLEQLFERVAKETANADNETSAFNATIDILGKGAGELNQTLKQVGADGLQSIIDQAKDAGQVMDEKLIQRLDDLGDTLDSAALRVKVFGAEAVSAIDQSAAAMGSFWDGLMASGGNFAAAFENVQKMAIEGQAAADKKALAEKEAREKQAAQRIADMQKAQAEEAAKAQLKIEEQNAKEREKLEKELQDAKADYLTAYVKKAEDGLRAQIKDMENQLDKFQSRMNKASEEHGVSGRRAIDMAVREEKKEKREQERADKAVQKAVDTAQNKLDRLKMMNPGKTEEELMDKLSDPDKAALEMFGKKGLKPDLEAKKQAVRDKDAPDKMGEAQAREKKAAADLKKLGEPGASVPTTGTGAGAEAASASVTTAGVSVNVDQDSVVEVLKEISGKLDALGWLGKWTGSGS